MLQSLTIQPGAEAGTYLPMRLDVWHSVNIEWYMWVGKGALVRGRWYRECLRGRLWVPTFKQVLMPPNASVTSLSSDSRVEMSWINSKFTMLYSSITTNATGAKPAISDSFSLL
jgi:hypothetical protein